MANTFIFPIIIALVISPAVISMLEQYYSGRKKEQVDADDE
jgi:hypothetical protein